MTIGEVKAHIEKALARSAETDAADISVSTDGGKVVLSGNVRSWSESEEVARARAVLRAFTDIATHLLWADKSLVLVNLPPGGRGWAADRRP